MAEGTLAVRRRARLERHVAACADCRAALAALAELPPLLTASAASVGDDDRWPRQRRGIMRRIDAVPDLPGRSRWPSLVWRVGFAAAFASVIAVVVYRSLQHPSRPALNVAEPAESLDDQTLLALTDQVNGVMAPGVLAGSDWAGVDLLAQMAPTPWLDPGLGAEPQLQDLGAEDLEQLADLLGRFEG